MRESDWSSDVCSSDLIMNNIINCIKPYIINMKEIKYRTFLIQKELKKDKLEYWEIEFCCLQLRKILELILFSSLTANTNLSSTNSKNFFTGWKIRELITKIEAINPNFYPEPVKINNSKNEINSIKNDFLTKKELLIVYQKVSKEIHIKNPFNKNKNKNKSLNKEYFKKITNKIVVLLETHIARPFLPNELYLIFMNGNDNNVEIGRAHV